MHAELKAYLKAKRNHEPEDRKSYLHSLELFATRMVDVLKLETPDVVLVDGAPAMFGDGFQVLRAAADKVAIGGTNPVLVDRIGAEFLGLWNNGQLASELGGHRTSPLLELAARRFGVALKAPAVVGDGASLVGKPRPVFFKALAPSRWRAGGCWCLRCRRPSDPQPKRKRRICIEVDPSGKTGGTYRAGPDPSPEQRHAMPSFPRLFQPSPQSAGEASGSFCDDTGTGRSH